MINYFLQIINVHKGQINILFDNIQNNHLFFSMEQLPINQMQKIRVKASELLSKFRHREDRYNFCREKSMYIIINFKISIFQMKIILTQLFFSNFSQEQKR